MTASPASPPPGTWQELVAHLGLTASVRHGHRPEESIGRAVGDDERTAALSEDVRQRRCRVVTPHRSAEVAPHVDGREQLDERGAVTLVGSPQPDPLRLER